MASVPPPCGYDSPNEESFSSGSGSGSSGSSPRFPFSTHASRREVDPEQGVRSPETASSNSSSLTGMVSRARNLKGSRVSIGDRIACFQWTWFTMTMVCSSALSVRSRANIIKATGGIANVLHSRTSLEPSPSPASANTGMQCRTRSPGSTTSALPFSFSTCVYLP